MKKSYFLLALFLIFSFASCTEEENLEVNQNQSLLKSYKLSKQSNGEYIFNIDLNEGAYTEIYQDYHTNMNNFHVYPRNLHTPKMNLSNEKKLNLNNNRLMLTVFDNEVEEKSVLIEDEITYQGKGKMNPNFLESYSIEYIGDNKYVLDFTVRKNVSVNFKYNFEENINEIHLKEGDAKTTNFTKIYTRTPSLAFKIDFVNYIELKNNSRGANSKTSYVIKKRPRYIEETSLY